MVILLKGAVLGSAAAVALLNPGQAWSGPPPVSAPNSISNTTFLEKCQIIKDDTKRLACYDRNMANQQEATERQQRETFGFSNYELEQRQQKAGIENEEVEKPFTGVKAEVVEFNTSPIGKAVIILQNRQIWQETNPSTLRGSIRPGTMVQIERENLGSFRLRAPGKRGFLTVERIR